MIKLINIFKQKYITADKAKTMLCAQHNVDNPRLLMVKSSAYLPISDKDATEKLGAYDPPKYSGSFRCVHFAMSAIPLLFCSGKHPVFAGVVFINNGDVDHALIVWLNNHNNFRFWDAEGKRFWDGDINITGGIVP